jgi:DNA-binding beta-propeller fold protein YncE
MNLQHESARRLSLAALVVVGLTCSCPAAVRAEVQRRLYVVTPGIRNYLEFGGAGILVYDIDAGYKLLRRIETTASREAEPNNIKGVCACAATRRLYFTTTKKLYAVDLVSEETLWERELPKGCDRPSITPDGKLIYVPSFEKDLWNVVEAGQGTVIATVVTDSGAHNTVCGLDGKRMYLAGLRSPLLSVADTQTHRVEKTVGPFSESIRPFTVNGAQTRCYVCVNELLGFEIGDITSGKKLARIEVAGYERGPVKRHGCPSHGIGLTPNEREIWLCDGHNSRLHVFDITTDPPRQTDSIALREQPGWVTFLLDGKHAVASTGEIIDTASKQIIATLSDEQGRQAHSEKVIEIHFEAAAPMRVGDQFGVGRVSVEN